MSDQSNFVSLEEEFATLTQDVMLGRTTVQNAITEFGDICIRRSAALRQEAQLYKAGHGLKHVRIVSSAEEMQAQADTWSLVGIIHVADIDDILGGQGPDVADQLTHRQRICQAVVQDPQLTRCAQVVAWLEDVAGQQLDAAPQRRWPAATGVWEKTFTREDVKSRQGAYQLGGEERGATELDPDAPIRGVVSLEEDDLRVEEQLLKHVWRLMRAGRVPEAVRFLESDCKQPWRAALLSGGGPWGPLPVGLHALEQQGLDLQYRAADLAMEMDQGGVPVLRDGWKWACYHAAKVAGSRPRAEAERVGDLEAAIYGSLCGDVQRMLPVCGRWEDAVWAYSRAWLELMVSSRLRKQAVTGGALPGLPTDQLVSSDVLSAALARVSTGDDDGRRRAGGADWDAAATQLPGLEWPLPQLWQEGETVHVPREFPDIFQDLVRAPIEQLRDEALSQPHVLQAALATSFDMSTLRLLKLWIEESAAATAAGHPRRRRRHAQQRADSPRAPVLMLTDGLDGDGDVVTAAADGNEDDASGQQPAKRRRHARDAVDEEPQLDEDYDRSRGLQLAGRQSAVAAIDFSSAGLRTLAAHLVLALRALGARATAVDDEDQAMDADVQQQGDEEVCGLQDDILQHYIAHLVQQQMHAAAATYIALLSPHRREDALRGLLAGLDPGVQDAACLELFADVARLYADLEDARADDQQPRRLEVDVGPAHLSSAIVNVVQDALRDPNRGPVARVHLLRWLLYPYLAGVDRDWEAADTLEILTLQCAELALGGTLTARAAAVLMQDVLPPGLAAAVRQRCGQQLQERLDAAGGEASPGDELEATQLTMMLNALDVWRSYFDLTRRVAAWLAAVNGPLDPAVVEEGQQLVQALLRMLDQDPWASIAATAPVDGDKLEEVHLILTPGGAEEEDVEAAGEADEDRYPLPYSVEQVAALRRALQGLAVALRSQGLKLTSEELQPDDRTIMVSLSLEGPSASALPGAWSQLCSAAAAICAGQLSSPSEFAPVTSVTLVNLHVRRPATALQIAGNRAMMHLVEQVAQLHLAMCHHVSAPLEGPEALLQRLCPVQRPYMTPTDAQHLMSIIAEIEIQVM